MTRIDSRSAPTTTNAGQADRAGLAGGANTTVTLKRRNAIRAKPPGLTSSGNPLQRARLSSIQQIEHETRQMIGMQRAIGFQNQLLAAAEMLNSFRMKLLDMIKKAVSS